MDESTIDREGHGAIGESISFHLRHGSIFTVRWPIRRELINMPAEWNRLVIWPVRATGPVPLAAPRWPALVIRRTGMEGPLG
jgi:hypothetical protein